MDKELIKDDVGIKLQVYAPVKGKVIGATASSGVYIPEQDEVVVLGIQVTITIDSIGILYEPGFTMGLRKGINYTFSAETPVHVM